MKGKKNNAWDSVIMMLEKEQWSEARFIKKLNMLEHAALCHFVPLQARIFKNMDFYKPSMYV